MLTTNIAFGQFSYDFLRQNENQCLYVSGNTIIGNNDGGDIGINYMLNKKFSVKVGFCATNKLAVVAPSEFLKSASAQAPVDNTKSFKNFENFNILIGRVFLLNSKSKIRFNIQCGPGISNVRIPSNWRWTENNMEASSYDYDINIKKEISFTLNPKIEWPIARVLGFSFGPMYVRSKNNTYFGGGIGVIYGVI